MESGRGESVSWRSNATQNGSRARDETDKAICGSRMARRNRAVAAENDAISGIVEARQSGDNGVMNTDSGHAWSVPRGESDVELLVVGDVDIQDRRDPRTAFVHVKPTLDSADLRYANLEGLYGDPEIMAIEAKSAWRHSDPAMFAAITHGGFDAVGCANNVNRGDRELLETIRMLDEADIAHTGAGATLTQAHEPAIVAARGVRFGFLQYTARYYGAEAIAGSDTPGVARIDPAYPEDLIRVRRDVEQARATVDVLIVSHHVRLSSVREVEDYQQEFAAATVEAGADLVFGHGAHLNQRIDSVSGTLVFHCIGQFAFDWHKTRHKREGLILRVLVQNQAIRAVSAVPVWRTDANDVYVADPSTEEGRQQIEHLRSESRNVSIEVTETDVVVRPKDWSGSDSGEPRQFAAEVSRRRE